jgi:hypothetical protein
MTIEIGNAQRHRVRLAHVNLFKVCRHGIFCNLGKGMTNFHAVDDARTNREYLRSIGF